MNSRNVDSSQDSFLQEYLSERDAPCPRCGYNLHKLQSDSCPECGDALTIRVGLVEPRMGAFITTLVALSVGTGAGLLLAILGIFAAPPGWWTEPAGVALLALLIVSGTGLACLLALRLTYRRSSQGVQWLFALAAIVFVLGAGAVVVANFD